VPDYPFEPKTNALLRPGQFWGVPLSDGRYACGRVLDISRDDAGGRMMFVAGLMDWVGDDPPTAESIHGASILNFGSAHIRTIREHGQHILGIRPLETDDFEAMMCLSAQHGGYLQRGYTVLRRATQEEVERLTVLSTWGYDIVAALAEHRFLANGS